MSGLRDRFLTPQVARAITSPSAILLAGAGTAAGILVGAPILAAAAVGGAAYAARVAFAVPRAPKSDINLSALAEPWRTFVAEAMDARARYRQALETATAGPLRSRLGEIGARLDDGVEETWRIARRGMALESALHQLEDPRQVQQRLAQARQGGADARIVESLQAQLDSTHRISRVAQEARQRLQLLDARLDEAVARAVELSLTADDAQDLLGVGSDVEAVVGEMESLRQALEETHRPGQAVQP
jgi:hypothetical protein